MTPQVWMIDPTGARRGLLTYSSLTAVERWLGVGTYRVAAPLTQQSVMAAAAGWRLAIVGGDGRPVMAGPVVEPEVSYGQDSGGRVVPTVVYAGEDDMCWLRDRAARPVPLNTLATQTEAYDVRVGQASGVIRQYVELNAGPSARPERRVPGLTLDLDSDPGAGGVVTGRARFQSVLELCAGLADGAGIGFRVISDASATKRFQVVVPRDLRGPARFSIGLRNINMLKWRLRAPKATHVVGGGRGEEEAREFIEAANEEQGLGWGRREDFFDFRSASSEDSSAELAEGTTRKLGESSATAQVQWVPVDTTALRYGRDYGLGDLVTIDVFGGVLQVQAAIREVEHRVTRQDGYRVLPRAGDIGASGTSLQRSIVDALTSRVSNLERTR